jgi:6-phosphogluconolactonase
MKINRRILSLALGAAAALALAAPALAAPAPGHVYVLSNQTGGNSVLVYDRAADGSLTFDGAVPTAGAGNGGGLGSQGAVITSRDGKWLFAVNAGSNSITSFEIRPGGLRIADVAASGGIRPTSVTYRKDVLYVLNAGTPNSIAGFHVDNRGRLTAIPGSARPLSGAQTNPAQVELSRDGRVLVVTERATNLITTYTLGKDDVASAPASYPSIGQTPFGFTFMKKNRLFVSDAAGASGASSYQVAHDGVVTPIMGLAPTGQAAACWAVVTKNGKFGYVTNAATGNVSGFAIGHDGSLTLLDPSGVSATTGGNPTDAALDVASRFLYIRNGNQAAINVLAVDADGSLATLPGIGGLPAGAAGIAAR